MHITNDQSSKQVLCYAPIYHQRRTAEDIFNRHIQPFKDLASQEVQATLQMRKVQTTKFSCRRYSVIAFVALAGVVALLFAHMGVPQMSDPIPRTVSKKGTINGEIFINTLTNQRATEEDIFTYALPHTTSSSMALHAFLAEMSLICGSVLAYCICSEINRIVENRNNRSENGKIDAILKKLSFFNAPGSREVLPHDVALAFPYLAESHLPLLNFSQLKAARKYHPDLFRGHLTAGSFASSQLAIWRLFQRLMEANPARLLKMLTHPHHKQIIASEPLFFQFLARQLQPLSQKLLDRLTEILETKILSHAVFKKQSNINCALIVQRVADGRSLQSIVRNCLESIDIRSDSDCDSDRNVKVYRKFLESGKLTVHSLDECYTQFKLCLETRDRELQLWFESYFCEHLDYFINHPQRSMCMTEIVNYKLDLLKLGIDQALAKEPFPPFNSADFTAAYQFATQFSLSSYLKALEKYYAENLTDYKFTICPESIASETLDLLAQMEKLFSDQKSPYTQLLKSKIEDILTQNPELIDALASCCSSLENPWLLSCLQDIYRSNPTLYASFWLLPLEAIA